jgi:hypothetical protein
VFAPAMEELIGFERLCIARSSSIISARTSEESLHPHSVTFRFTIMPPRISQPHCAGGRGKHVVPKSKAAAFCKTTRIDLSF